MSKFCVITSLNFILLCCTELLAQGAAEFPVKSALGVGVLPENPTAMQWDAELNFSYIDAINSPLSKRSAISGYRLTDAATSPMATSRTLGLSKARLDLTLASMNRFVLFMGLRPDALNESQTVGTDGTNVTKRRDFDRRSGISFRQTSELRFLDNYFLGINAFDYLTVRYGVFRDFAVEDQAYKPLLAFGLQVRFPENFLGLNLTYRLRNHEGREMLGSTDVSTDFFLLHGRELRGETLLYNSASDDHAPAVSSDYIGGASVVKWLPSKSVQWSLLLGYLDNVESGFKVRETLAGVWGQFLIDNALTQIKVVTEFRLGREAFHSSVGNLPSLTQQSFGGSFSARYAELNWFLFGVQMGRSDRNSQYLPDYLDSFQGSYLEAGWLRALSREVKVSFMAAREVREVKLDDGSKAGGFGDGSKKLLNRFALEINYEIGT